MLLAAKGLLPLLGDFWWLLRASGFAVVSVLLVAENGFWLGGDLGRLFAGDLSVLTAGKRLFCEGVLGRVLCEGDLLIFYVGDLGRRLSGNLSVVGTGGRLLYEGDLFMLLVGDLFIVFEGV